MESTFRAGLVASPRLLSAAVLALLVTLTMGCNQDRAKAVAEMNKGITAYQGGQTMSALEHLKAAKNMDPTYAEPALYLGQIYHREMSELDNAEQAYREALSREPDNAETAYKLGTVLADKKKPSEAQTYFRQAVDRDPTFAKAWFRLGLTQQAQGKFPEAVESYTKSIRNDARMKMDDEDPGGAAYHALGDLYTRFGFYDKALKVYENGIQNNDGSARLYAGQGVAQMKLERFKEAEQSFEKALEIDPQHVSATFNLAVARNELGERDAAIAVLEKYLSRSEDEVRRNAAQGLLQKLRDSGEKKDE